MILNELTNVLRNTLIQVLSYFSSGKSSLLKFLKMPLRSLSALRFGSRNCTRRISPEVVFGKSANSRRRRRRQRFAAMENREYDLPTKISNAVFYYQYLTKGTLEASPVIT